MFPASIKVSDLNRKHPEYDIHKFDLDRISMLTSGGHKLTSQLDTVLHSRPMEPAEMKEYRKNLFSYNNILGTVNGWYVAKLFEKSPSVDMVDGVENPEMQSFLNDSDRSGTPFIDSMRKVASSILKFKRVFAVIDQPEQKKEYATRAEELADKATAPYMVVYDPRHVINWGRDGFGALQWILARTDVVSVSGEFPHAPQREAHWWYFSGKTQAHYRAVYENEHSEPELAQLVFERTVSRFNVVEIEVSDDHWLASRALLPAIKLLNLENALDWQLFINALPILVIKGRIDEKPTVNELGYLLIPEGGDASYLEQSGAMADTLRERCQEHLENCYRLMYVVQQGRSGNATAAAQSGISKEADTMPSLHVCSAIGDSLRIGMKKILEIVSSIAGIQNVPDVRGFMFPTDDVDGSLATLEKLNSLQIPSDTLYTEVEVGAAKEVLGDQPQNILDAVEKEIRSGPTRSARIEAEKREQVERFAESFSQAAA